MSTVNVRTIYDSATSGLTQGATTVLEDNSIQIEFRQGTISSSSALTFQNESGFFLGANWWNTDANHDTLTMPASGFAGGQAVDGLPQSNFPYIGSLIANKSGGYENLLDAHHPVDANWLQFCPGRRSVNDPINQLFIKAVAKADKKITGYTIYFYDAVASADGIGITSGDVNTTTTTTTTHNARQVLDMNGGNWNTSGNDIDGYSGVRTYSKTGIAITGSNYIYISIDDNVDVFNDPALIKLEFTVEDDVLAPPTVTFPATSPVVYTNAQVNIADGNGWEYSINSGASWISGTGDSFQLSVGTYNAGTIQVRNNDGTRESAEVNNPSQIIVSPPPPTVNFPGSPVLIQSATVDITSLGTGASGWQYSIDTGANWSNGTGTSFSLLAGTYAQNQIQVRNGSGTNWSTTINNSSQIVVTFSPPVVVFPASGENGIVNITLGNSATAWQYSIDSGVSFSNGSGTKFTLQAETYAQNQIQVHNGDGTNWSATENNGSEIVISAPPTPPPEPVSTTEPVDIRKSYYPESKVNSTSNSLFNKVYSQKLLTSVDKIERTPLELKKDKSVEQYHNGTQDRLLRIKSKAMNNK